MEVAALLRQCARLLEQAVRDDTDELEQWQRCETCGGLFRPSRSDARYCVAACRMAASRARRRAAGSGRTNFPDS